MEELKLVSQEIKDILNEIRIALEQRKSQIKNITIIKA